MSLLLVTSIAIVLAVLSRGAYCDEWEYKLVGDILRNYDSAIRPSLFHNMTLNVTFGLALAQIIDVVSVIHIFRLYQIIYTKIV